MKDLERTASPTENGAVIPRFSCNRNREGHWDKNGKAGKESPADRRGGVGHLRMVLAGNNRAAGRCRPPRPAGSGTDGKRETVSD